MDILFLTTTNNLLGLASRLSEEGHTVKLFSDGETGRNGFVERVKHPFEAIKECKFIIADGPISQACWAWAKQFNKPVLGTHPLAEQMNADVYKEWQIVSKLGLPTPETEVIDDLSVMYDKVLNWNNARTTIRYDRIAISVDHQRWLAWAMDKMPLNKKILLQRPVWGEEVRIEGWFDGLKWARPFILKTPNEDRMGGCSMLGLFKREWVDKLITPWEAFLRQIEYKGPFRVKAFASKDKVEHCEAHFGFEFPSVYAFLEGLKDGCGDFLNKIAFGVCEEIPFTTDYSSCVVVGTALNEPKGAPVIGLDDGNRKHVYFGNVDVVEEEILVSNAPKWIYAVAARGRNIEESFGRLYFTKDRVRIPEATLMTGLGPLHTQWFNRVRDLGYL